MIAETPKSTADQQKKKKTTKKKYAHGKHPNSLAALRPIPWKKGQSGNPKGPPKAKTNLMWYIRQFANLTKQELNAIDTKGLTLSQIAALNYCKSLASGDFKFIKELLDRELGKAPEHITTEGEQRITIERV